MNIFKNLISFTVVIFVSIFSLLGIDVLPPSSEKAQLPTMLSQQDADKLAPIEKKLCEHGEKLTEILKEISKNKSSIKNIALASWIIFKNDGTIEEIPFTFQKKIIAYESGKVSDLKNTKTLSEQYKFGQNMPETILPKEGLDQPLEQEEENNSWEQKGLSFWHDVYKTPFSDVEEAYVNTKENGKNRVDLIKKYLENIEKSRKDIEYTLSELEKEDNSSDIQKAVIQKAVIVQLRLAIKTLGSKKSEKDSDNPIDFFANHLNVVVVDDNSELQRLNQDLKNSLNCSPNQNSLFSATLEYSPEPEINEGYNQIVKKISEIDRKIQKNDITQKSLNEIKKNVKTGRKEAQKIWPEYYCSEQKIFYDIYKDEGRFWKEQLRKKSGEPHFEKVILLIYSRLDPCALCRVTACRIHERTKLFFESDLKTEFGIKILFCEEYKDNRSCEKQNNVLANENKENIAFCQVCSSSSSVPNSAE